MKNVEIIIHLAAVGGPLSLEELNKTNLEGLKNLLELSQKKKIKHFIYFSSIAVYGEQLNVVENSPKKPYDNYGKSKKQTEEYIEKNRNKFSFPITIIRPSHIYGPNGKSNINNLIKTIIRGHFVIFGDGKSLINIIFIDDLIDAVIKMLKTKKVYGEGYIISDDRVYTSNELAQTAADIAQVRKPIKIPYFIAYFVGFIFELISKIMRKNMPLSRSRVKNMTRSRSFIVKKAKKDFGYYPQIHLKEGLKETIEWLKKEN